MLLLYSDDEENVLTNSFGCCLAAKIKLPFLPLILHFIKKLLLKLKKPVVVGRTGRDMTLVDLAQRVFDAFEKYANLAEEYPTD